MLLASDNNITNILDAHFSMKCPHCNALSNITAISYPRYELSRRFNLNKLGIVYMCDACKEPIFLKFKVSLNQNRVLIFDEKYEEIERPKETFEIEYLTNNVKDDFSEALICYSNQCYNAFASMCRRCIQSVSDDLGAKGHDKVQNQIKELKDLAEIDDETFEILKQIIISGHDGTHPHLPKLSKERAKILLELMKDVLYQLYIRKAKIQESVELRKTQIETQKQNNDNQLN